MPTLYCPTCGSPNQYAFDKPANCCSCLGLMRETIANVAPKPVIQSRQIQTQGARRPTRQVPMVPDDTDEDLTFEDIVPPIDKLDIQINIPPPVKVKASEVVGSNSGIVAAPARPKVRGRKKKHDTAALMDMVDGLYKRSQIDLGGNDNGNDGGDEE